MAADDPGDYGRPRHPPDPGGPVEAGVAGRCQRAVHQGQADGPQAQKQKGSTINVQRKAVVEQVNEQIKEARGLRHYLLRDIEKISAEGHLISTTHNLLKLFKYRQLQKQQLAMAAG